ncbi:cupin domain-containing protein [Azohydromonas lata]|uniref:Cupin domain-containing protein n=1 Tax=Azohydromonas lata TaxID=45677 RepID=A0ABU5ILQ4_9BURK|nr:cupin domain-containing protein [Azohydromonas lata]MDZ5459840.1 cupin domain-containing protein [Azohydromonas lata]
MDEATLVNATVADRQAVVVKAGEGERLPVLGTQVRFLCEGAHMGRRFSMMEVTLPLDMGPPPHDHDWDEAYYVLEGDVRFQLGDESRLFTQGDFIYAPGGTLHAFKGASSTPARVLVLDAPATMEGFFREAAREITVFPRDLAKVPALGQKHQLRFRPPA